MTDWQDIHDWTDLRAVRAALAAGADPDRIVGGHMAPLHSAACSGSAEVLAELLTVARQVDRPDAAGRTPLWHAVRDWNREKASALIAAGADPWRPMGGARASWRGGVHDANSPGHRGRLGLRPPDAFIHRSLAASGSESAHWHAPNGLERTGPRRTRPRGGDTHPVRGPIPGGQFPVRPGQLSSARGDGEALNHLSGGAGAPHAGTAPDVPDRTAYAIPAPARHRKPGKRPSHDRAKPTSYTLPDKQFQPPP
ncbi:ankyrin repeat domain-containing protein [Streptomyces asiaticus]